MSRIFFVICLFLSTGLFAQGYEDRRFRISIGTMFNGTVGAQNYRTSDRFITGKSRSGFGGYGSFDLPLPYHLMVGIYVSNSGFSMLEGETKQQLAERYGRQDFFLSLNTNELNYQLRQLGINIARRFDFKGGCFYPYIRLGGGSVDMNPVYAARIKQKNDNYFVQYSLSRDINATDGENFLDFFLPSAGFNIEGRLNDFFWIQGGLSYTGGGSYTLYLTETKTDLYEQRETTKLRLRQPISMFNASIGLQLRCGRRRN